MSAKTKASEAIGDWQALHRQWWDSVVEGAKRFTPPSASPADAMKGFGDLFGSRLGSSNDAAVERFLAGSRQFLQWVEGMSAAVAARGGTPGRIDDWAALFKQAAGPLFEGSNPLLHLFQGLASDGARGFEQFAAGLPRPGEAIAGELKSLLGLPAFGFNREQQERLQQFAVAQMEYQEAMNAYNAEMLRASKLAFEKLESKLAQHEEPGRRLESLRAVYDVWVDAAEEAYAEVALSPEFRTAYGNLVNRQMRLRQHVQAEVERQTAQLGMPSRSELNSVHQRMQEMRRRIRELEDRLAAASSAPAESRSERPVRAAAPAKKPAVRATKKPPAPAAAKPRARGGAKPARKAATARRHLNRLA
jgi:class III poly(R)-hydroxyalkanoic acid synthase PhaE subunit